MALAAQLASRVLMLGLRPCVESQWNQIKCGSVAMIKIIIAEIEDPPPVQVSHKFYILKLIEQPHLLLMESICQQHVVFKSYIILKL